MRIAVVDDDATFVDLLAYIFGERGWDTISLHQHQDAFIELSAQQPDLIVLDLHMGSGHSGWDILTLLEGDPRTFHIPVIICSAATEEIRDRQDWLRERGIPTIPKPFELEDLLRLAEDALSEPRQGRPRHQSA
jgi:DNA-binding response OmpR family regulator